MPKVKQRIHLRYEEAREYVINHGTKVTKLRCPFCAWLRTLTDKNLDEFYPDYNFDNPLLVGCKAGRGGIFSVPEGSYTISQIKDDPQWKPLIDEIREKAKAILEEVGEEA